MIGRKREPEKDTETDRQRERQIEKREDYLKELAHAIDGSWQFQNV